jgi:hypothetical protein
MVQGPEEEYGVDTRIGQPERPGITDLRGGQRHSRTADGIARLLDVERHRIHQMDPVSELRKPDGVSTGAAADVCHQCGRSREVPLEQRLGAQQFQHAGAFGKPVAFESQGVKRLDLGAFSQEITRPGAAERCDPW